ncbi:MAG: DUF1178 family protein [Rhizobiales bacterium]|nr:DUF1178 family protein [Hyphomicrobiales bacterium]
MIKFTLKCGEEHSFDGWFRSNADFLEQQKRNIIACPSCGDSDVSKALMTPSVPVKSNQKSGFPVPAEIETSTPEPAPAAATDSNKGGMMPNPAPNALVPVQAAPPPAPTAQQNIPNVLENMPPELRAKVFVAVRQWRDAVVASSENVGPKFAEEARKIHYKEAKERPILGEASFDEVQELIEEGIECAPLPVLPEDHN